MSSEALPKMPALTRFILPAVFVALIALLGVGLSLNPREILSPLIGKPAPAFVLPQLHAPDRNFSPADLRGRVWLLNVWASWCASCRVEHPVLMDLARLKAVPIYGLDYKDVRADGLAWLRQFGDPYTLSAFDANGEAGIDYGVYGVPETYLIDRHGIIRYKHVGILTPDIAREKVLPLVKQLEAEP